MKVSELGENGQGHDFLVAVSVLPADNSEDAKQEAAKVGLGCEVENHLVLIFTCSAHRNGNIFSLKWSGL